MVNTSSNPLEERNANPNNEPKHNNNKEVRAEKSPINVVGITQSQTRSKQRYICFSASKYALKYAPTQLDKNKTR